MKKNKNAGKCKKKIYEKKSEKLKKKNEKIK